MPLALLQQVTIEYRELGPADSTHPPVLFVHGILVDHRLWLKVAEELARNGFRCILPDLPLGVAHRAGGPRGGVDAGERGRNDQRVHRRAGPARRHAGRQRHRRWAVPAPDRRPPRQRRPAGADQLRRVRQVPAIPVQRRVRDDAGAQVDPLVVQADEGDRAEAFAPRLRAAAATRRRCADRIVDRTHEHRPADRAEPRHAVAWRRRNGSGGRRDPAPAIRQARDDRVGHGRPQLHPCARAQARGAVPERSMVEVPGARTFVALDAPRAVVDAIATVGARA